VEILGAAKETIALAEERLLEEDSRQFDSAWQEMLNHATNRVLMELYLGLSENIIFTTRLGKSWSWKATVCADAD
jgi:hypothetical protein